MALPFVTDTNADAIFQKTYTKTYKSMIYGSNSRVLLNSIKKVVGGGESVTQAMEYAPGNGFSASFAKALANRGISKAVKFTLDWAERHGQAIVRNTDIQLSKSVGAAVNMKIQQIKAATAQLANELEHCLIRSGYNEIGQILTISSATVALAARTDANSVNPGDVHQFSSALNASSMRNSGGELTVLSVDRDAGTITYTANVSTLGAVAVGDFIHKTGDKVDAGTLNCIGLGGMFPLVAPSGVDYGAVDRSVAPQQLAGVRMDLRGKTAKEQMLDLIVRVRDAGGDPKEIIATNDFVGKVMKEQESQIPHQQAVRDADGEVAGLFTKGFEVDGVVLYGSPFMYSDRIFAVNFEDFELRTVEKDPVFNNTFCSTNAPMIDDPSTDSQIARLKTLCLLVCNAMGHQGVGQIA